MIITWNVAGRVKRQPEQAKLLLGLGADVLCLQEITPSTFATWQVDLQQAGYHTVISTADGERSRPLHVLTATRVPLEAQPVAAVPWPERVLAARMRDGSEIVNVHSPTSAKTDLAKVRTHESVFKHLARRVPRTLRILCGDLNTPRKEQADGTIWTFARNRYGGLRPDRGESWDHAELSLLQGLGRYGFCDAFRELHGYEQQGLSWEWARFKGGYRLDHLVVSGPWRIASCEYLHAFRTSGLSDHSALRAEIEPEDPRPDGSEIPMWPDGAVPMYRRTEGMRRVDAPTTSAEEKR